MLSPYNCYGFPFFLPLATVAESPEIDLTFESLEAWKQCKRLKKSVSNVQERRSSTGNTVSNVQERRSSTGNTVSNVQEHRSSAGNTVSNVQDRRSNAGNTVSNVQECRSNAGNISRFNFLQDDDDLNTQELDELDQLIVHEVRFDLLEPIKIYSFNFCQCGKRYKHT